MIFQECDLIMCPTLFSFYRFLDFIFCILFLLDGMSTFACAICDERGSFREIITHSTTIHPDCVVKYSRNRLDEFSGQVLKETISFGVTPSQLRPGLLIDPTENESINIVEQPTPSDDHSSTTSDGHDHLDKEVTDSLEDGEDTSTAEEEEASQTEKEFIQLTPKVAAILAENGKIDCFSRLWRLIAEKRFPMNDIAFQLFLGVVDWYSKEKTSSMRYTSTVKLFWRTGYRLFKNKFLHFMSGWKNSGDIIHGDATTGCCAPEDSRINFAVPSAESIRMSDGAALFNPDTIRPGILQGVLEKVVEMQGTEGPFKICVDGTFIVNSNYGVNILSEYVNLYQALSPSAL